MNKRLSIAALTATLAVVGAVTAGAQTYNYDYWGSREVRIAASYINRDTGAATENPNINVPSNCRTPDRFDEAQTVSPAGSTANNVHNDACLLDSRGNKLDDGATYESYGVGIINACPDPDNAGRRTAVLDAGPTGDGVKHTSGKAMSIPIICELANMAVTPSQPRWICPASTLAMVAAVTRAFLPRRCRLPAARWSIVPARRCSPSSTKR